MSEYFENLNELLSSLAKGRFTTSQEMASSDWFKGKVDELEKDDEASSELIKGNKTVTGKDKIYTKRPVWGKMYSFLYVPQNRNKDYKLPYYDMMPLIFMIDSYKDGFLGINLHYLPRDYREVLLNVLVKTSLTDKNMDEKTRVRLTYNKIKSFSKLKMAVPCIKRYKARNIRSKIVQIPADEWNLAIHLPTERFRKKNKSGVWKDTINKIKNFRRKP